MQDEVTVSQADERAVAEFHRQSFETLFATTDADIDAGINRAHKLLCQAFARHRHQAERETLARMEWRDIESAPSASGKEQNNLRVIVIGGIFQEATIVLADGEFWRMRAKEGAKAAPTHWMPLPPAPEAGQ